MNLKTKDLTFIAIMIAIATVLNIVSGIIPFFKMPQGGSVVILSTLLIMMISVKFGVKVGILVGFVYGLLGFLLVPYFLTPIQLFLDNFLAMMVFGLGTLFIRGKVTYTKIVIAYFICCTLSFLCSFVSGVVFFGEYAGEGQSVLVYSFLYNITYALPTYIVNIVLLAIPALKNVLFENFSQQETNN